MRDATKQVKSARFENQDFHSRALAHDTSGDFFVVAGYLFQHGLTAHLRPYAARVVAGV
ncbi:MAG: hypothetical protein RL295_1096 [Pseudomonadota bacterium]|jgi:hypothetical protein